MGTLLKSDIIAEATAFLGNRADITDARYVRWLNLAQMRIARLKVWEELQALDTSLVTVASDKFITEPSNIRKIYTFRLIDGSNSRILTGKPPKSFDQAIPLPSRFAEGRPTVYTRWAGKIELYKVPDAVYSLDMRYSKWPTAFTTGADIVSDLEEKDDALIMLMVSWGFLSLRNLEDATIYWKVYRDMINDAATEDVERPDIDIKPEGLSSGSISGNNPWQDPFRTTND